jgi:hypothetical protein
MTRILNQNGEDVGAADRPVAVRIDRLVLNGIAPADQRAFVAGLKTELARALAPQAAQALAAQRTPRMSLGRMPLEPGQAGARRLGAGVAKAIGKGVTR